MDGLFFKLADFMKRRFFLPFSLKVNKSGLVQIVNLGIFIKKGDLT